MVVAAESPTAESPVSQESTQPVVDEAQKQETTDAPSSTSQAEGLEQGQSVESTPKAG